jgi:SAM-dependent methyltransferase
MDAGCCQFLREVVGVPVWQSDDPVSALADAGQFDVVAMWHVIEHLENPRQVIEAAGASLRPGGILVIAAPNPGSLQFRLFGTRWTHLDAPRHLFLIPPAELVALGRSVGLEPALVTTVDEGSLGWNRFGWRESLAGFASGRYARAGLRLTGSFLGWLAAPIERRRVRGATYTLVLRKPVDASID